MYRINEVNFKDKFMLDNNEITMSNNSKNLADKL